MIDTIEERFGAKVDIRGADECWEWTAIRSPAASGYGIFVAKSGAGGLVRAHRFSYALANGEIPKGALVCHKCDNPPCVNPNHLFLGTHSDNQRDSLAKDRTHLAKLTVADVCRIRAMLAEGWSNAGIANAFGVSPQTINNIRRGKSWRGIGEPDGAQGRLI